jgi:hypothetical protein
MNYIRLIEINNSQQLTIIKLALNKENVEYRTLFEKTLQVADAYALGNNGAIIEVSENDFEKAKEILSELGIELDYNVQEDRFELVNIIDKVTRNLPIIGSLELAYRFLLLVCLSFMFLMLAILVNITRISKSDLVGHSWCVEEIIHEGKIIQPNTKAGFLISGFPEKCQEEISFENRQIILPGFETFPIRGQWKFNTDETLVISKITEFKDIYEGEYLIKTNLTGTMEFISDKTTIVISRNK